MNELNSLVEAIRGLAEIEEDSLTEEAMAQILEGVDQQFAPTVVTQSINQIVTNLEDQGLDKREAKEAIDALIETLNDMIYGSMVLTGKKKILVDTVTKKMTDIFYQALDKFHSYSIELPMTLAPGAKEPTYAHDTDAAADLYAMEDQLISAGTYGNMIKTGVKIQLPEGWLALILPRSSIGLKTPLRLSNSVGLIDSSYRGELGVIYDNTAFEDYQIKAGDRIAQLLVMPSYRFKAQVVDSLEESDRGEGGFGSTGV